ncbi:MAG: 4-alpha-glucanotransferase [Thermoanaerobaculia bacterium]|nr:4-alpha-glucanotransferase [Thermoanaerobaculia bacterium]
MKYGRSSGVLLHVTTLPSEWGSGDLGPEAERFVRWLASGNQRVWQILPLNPVGGGSSPYTALSAFAGNPDLISPERLAEDGLLEPAVAAGRHRALSAAWDRAKESREIAQRIDSWSATEDVRGWLDDWVLFATIREIQGDRSWRDWPDELRHRDSAALEKIRDQHGDEMRFHRFCQWMFQLQWDRIHDYAVERGISMFGDAPIYVSWDSADVWAHPDRFLLDDDLEPTVVAGVPPDYFSETGQRWGNPIYDWARMKRDSFGWWIERLRRNLALVDVLRLDHFRAFAGYWEIPASEETAVNGQWKKGPGIEVFRRATEALGPMPLVAEDLGTITPDVERLLEKTGYPGMKVMQFGFGDPDNIHLPHRYSRDTIGYTGTHDNDTFLGWFRSAGEKERKHAKRYLGARSERDIVSKAIEALYRSRAETAIVPMQDVLGLGSDARMNTPGTVEGNWRWRLEPDQLIEKDAKRLATLATETGRSR